MERKRKSNVETEEKKEIQAHATSGKALAVFFVLMVIITWANTMLQEMTIATVSTTTTQRGSLEKNYTGSGTLSAEVSISTNETVTTISDQSRGLKVRIAVDEGVASEIAIGDVASITVGNSVYQCVIMSITPSNVKQGVYDVDFILPGDVGSVGANASMRLRKRTVNYDILIPLTALRQDEDGSFVYVAEQQESSLGAHMTVRRVNVNVLDTDSSRAALQGGVSQRDIIVTRGDREISDGDRVRLAEE